MSKLQKIRQVISHVFVVAWMIVIFCFSAQPGEESADLSGGISHLFMQIWNWIFQLGWDEAQLLEMTAIWDFPIRKLAHMTEFGLLAVLVFAAIRFYTQIDTQKKRYLCAWLAAVVYAASDEFHQLFVPGRSGNLFDVGVDTCGITIALVLLYFVRRIYGRIRQL
ncbi:MAG: VanZ family protein [Agathobacter sp.]|nr:VanZ family protein [Agathobacter sp.]